MRIEQTLFSIFISAGMTPEGACALLGNIRPESCYRANNVEDRMHNELRWTDEEYTDRVMDGRYSVEQFIEDKYGYGFPQWTHAYRKRKFYNYMKSNGVRIDNPIYQGNFMVVELKEDYPKIWNILTTTHDIDYATVQVMIFYEGPANQGTQARNERIGYAKDAWNICVGSTGIEDIIDTPETNRSYHFDSVSMPLLGYDRSGEAVISLHGMLMARGYPIESDPMNYYGKETKNVVMEFQKAAGLKPDGMVGPKTYAAFFKV